MSSDNDSWPTLRVRGPADLLQAVPYLLGFHPSDSLVLIGLDAGRLVVTVRLDLVDAAEPGLLADSVAAMARGGATAVVGAVYDTAPMAPSDTAPSAPSDTAPSAPSDTAPSAPSDTAPSALSSALPWSGVVDTLELECERCGCELIEVLRVSGGRWWSYCCASADASSPSCCPPEGRELPDAPSAFVAAATVAGMVALPDRQSLAAVLQPAPETRRIALEPLIRDEEGVMVRSALDGAGARYDRSVKRAIFAAARAADHSPVGECRAAAIGDAVLSDAEVARYVVALASISLRDAVWMAVDDGRLDGRALWAELARRAPAPYDAAPLFLFGWGSWRAGNGALAGMAADRAIDSDRTYSAADLLLAALNRGVDPRRLPRLRLPRSA